MFYPFLSTSFGLVSVVSLILLLVLDNILKRLFNMLKFSWVLVQALLYSLTAWLNSLCQEHISISTVLRIERCMLTHEVKKVTTWPGQGSVLGVKVRG